MNSELAFENTLFCEVVNFCISSHVVLVVTKILFTLKKEILSETLYIRKTKKKS